MYSLVIVNGREKVLCQAAIDRLINTETSIMIVDTFMRKWQAERELKRVRAKSKRCHDWQSWLNEEVDDELDVTQE